MSKYDAAARSAPATIHSSFLTIPSSGNRMCAGSLNRQRRQSAFPSVFSRLQRGQPRRLASLSICDLDNIATPPSQDARKDKKAGEHPAFRTAHVSVRRMVTERVIVRAELGEAVLSSMSGWGDDHEVVGDHAAAVRQIDRPVLGHGGISRARG